MPTVKLTLAGLTDTWGSADRIKTATQGACLIDGNWLPSRASVTVLVNSKQEGKRPIHFMWKLNMSMRIHVEDWPQTNSCTTFYVSRSQTNCCTAVFVGVLLAVFVGVSYSTQQHTEQYCDPHGV